VFVFVNVIVIDIVSPAKHDDWEGVTTTRIGESASWDIVGFVQCTRVPPEGENLARANAVSVAQEDRGPEDKWTKGEGASSESITNWAGNLGRLPPSA